MHEPGYFTLRPFMAGALTDRLAESTDRLTISGHVIRRTGVIEIEYRVTGEVAGLLLPENTGIPKRCHELWQHSCFELFFAMSGDSAYWEVNLSPKGDWNIYRFTDYRSGMREEPLAVQPVCRIVIDGDLFSLGCTIDCQLLIDDAADLETAISCVIRDTTGCPSYWALDHLGAEPDFHIRASFSMVLPGIKKCDTVTL